MSTLYRKYRPQTFNDVYGQNHIKRTIQNELISDKVAHAYLFCGPRGVGKTTTARLLAKALNCVNRKVGEYEPCNNCLACKDLMDGRSMDIIEIDAASNTGVDNVREHIINSARFLPNSGKYKIFIIDEVHMLSTAAFNALLKILEEPPNYIKFILATTEIHKILPTIISRCQRFDFKKIDSTNLRLRLKGLVESEGKSVDEAVYNLVIKNADGCLRDAESLLGQLLILDEKHITLEQVELVLPIANYALADDLIGYLYENDLKGSITIINKIAQDGVNLEYLNKDLIEYTRKILLYSIYGSNDTFVFDLDENLLERVKFWSTKFSISFLLKIIEIFIKSLNECKNTQIAQLPLELAVVSIFEINNADLQNKIILNNQNNLHLASQQQNINLQNQNVLEKQNTPQITPKQEENKFINIEIKNENKVFIDNNLSLDLIFQKWIELKNKIQQENYSLSCILGVATPKNLNGNCLILVCKHKFNVDKLNEVKNKTIIEKFLFELFGSEIKIELSHDPTLDSKIQDSQNITLGEVLKMNRNENENENKSIQNGYSKNSNNSKQTNNPNATFDKVLDIFGGTVV